MEENKYDKVRAHIDDIRQSMREVSDDSTFTDEQIYKALIDARALILERRLKKGKQLPEYMYQEVCMLLCLDTYHDCDCVPEEFGCKVLKTVKELPNGLYNGSMEILRVSTLNGKEISMQSEALHRARLWRKTGKNNYYYVRVNNRLALFNIPYNNLKAVKVKGIFVDPAIAASYSICPDGTSNCVDVTSNGFGSVPSDNLAMYDMVLKKLLQTDSMPEDRSNDADSSVINKRI